MATFENGSAVPMTLISIGIARFTTGAVVTGTGAPPPRPPPAEGVAASSEAQPDAIDAAAATAAITATRMKPMRGPDERI
jgi:hypothetical protein